MSSRFTLNLGLRYQINTPYTEINDRLAGFRPGVKSQVQPNAPVGLFILATPVFRTAW